MARAIVVGSLNMDLVVTVAAHPRVGETVAGKTLRYLPGGKGANQAIACRRLGAEVAMVGRVGNDAFGTTLIAAQQAEGVDTQHLRVIDGASTGIALITVAADSTNTIVVTAGANAALTDHDLDAVAFARDDVLLTQLETPLPVVEAALHRAGEAGALRILNPSPSGAFDPRLLPFTDILVLNEIELAAITGLTVPPEDEPAIAAAAAQLVKAGCKHVIVTLGPDGAQLHAGDTSQRIAGRRVAATDTTGAGDCFTGALAAGLLCGLSLADSCRFANAAASISVTRSGATPSMPTLAEVEAQLL